MPQTISNKDQRHRFLPQAGTGITTPTGSNTHTGATTVSQGTLVVDGSIVSFRRHRIWRYLGRVMAGVSGISGAGTGGPGNSPGI